jgi:PBP superfamily domain
MKQMRRFNARRAVPACALSAVAAASLLAPGVASAKKSKVITQCSGVSVVGQGASGMVSAMGFWDTQFSSATDTNPAACSGTQGTKGTPTVGYNSTSSGKGLNSWGSEGAGLVADPPGSDGFAANNAFLGTEEPPNPTQATNIEGQETVPGSVTNTVLSYPVLQQAIAPIVHLPANCVATSTSNPGRLVLNNVQLEKIYAGEITEWSQITGGGDKLSGTGCNANAEITRVVRPDASGITHILKRYLGLIDTGSLTTASGSETWDELSGGSLNIVWPTGSTPIVSSSSTGDGNEIAKVASTESSIGYGALADIRNNTSFIPAPGGTGGASTATFWTPVHQRRGGRESDCQLRQRQVHERDDQREIPAEERERTVGCGHDGDQGEGLPALWVRVHRGAGQLQRLPGRGYRRGTDRAGLRQLPRFERSGRRPDAPQQR